MKYVLAIDQGTTGTRAILFDESLNQACSSYLEHRQIYPQNGWVEHDPEEIFANCLRTAAETLAKAGQLGISPDDIKALGIANQGETVVVWDRETGRPVYNAIVWRCRRTADRIEDLRGRPGFAESVRNKTGLTLDAYFSATKFGWILDHVEGVRQRMAQGGILAGTLDSWIIWKLTAGKQFATDFSTASRTMLFNIHQLDWDEEILDALGLPRSILARVLPTSGWFGDTEPKVFHGLSLPISGSVVDQYGALFAQGCFEKGMVKCTYGTGCFIQMNIGDRPVIQGDGILTSIGWMLGGRLCYVFDGAIYIAGAALQWLRDQLKVIADYREVDELAEGANDNGGVFFVPAFSGLAAPVWDQYARGLIIGITSKTGREHFVRAALESIAYQVKNVLDAMQHYSRQALARLQVDGGVTKSEFLMQFQADMLGLPVAKARITEASALGAALFAGLATGVWAGAADIQSRLVTEKCFLPRKSDAQRAKLMSAWNEAVRRSLDWARVLK